MRRGRALMKAMLQAVVSNDARPRDMRDYARLGVTSTAQPVECSATGMVPVPGAPGTPCRQPASRDDFAQAPTRAMMTAARVHRDGMDAGAPHLGSVIAAHLREWDTSPAFVELAIFESDDATEIAGAIDAFCDRHLGGRVARGLFHQSSIGSVTGVELADGRRVVIKAHQPERTRAFLAEIVRIQSHLAERGVFATEVLAGPLAARTRTGHRRTLCRHRGYGRCAPPGDSPRARAGPCGHHRDLRAARRLDLARAGTAGIVRGRALADAAQQAVRFRCDRAWRRMDRRACGARPRANGAGGRAGHRSRRLAAGARPVRRRSASGPLRLHGALRPRPRRGRTRPDRKLSGSAMDGARSFARAMSAFDA